MISISDYLPFTIYRISGHSMEPTIKMGSKVLVFQWAYLFSEPKKGDVIIFKKGKEYWIKRITNINNEGILVSGDNKEDSLTPNLIRRKNIIGKVVGK